MLSKKTKYAINALAYIAKHGEKKTNRSLFDYKNEKETADDNVGMLIIITSCFTIYKEISSII
ncbi:MAG: hypothetical protein WDA08_02040 [Weeksellaceae bacterium]